MTDFDWQLERRKIVSTQRKLIFAVAIIFLLILFEFFRYSNLSNTEVSFGTNYIAQIPIEGALDSDQDKFSALESIEKNKEIKAVIFTINSPGGGVYASQRYYNIIRSIAEKKPTIAVIEDTAASGAYMAAMACDRIFADTMSITGSIGVLAQFGEITDMAHKLGIKLQSIKSTPLKAMPNPLEKTTPEAQMAITVVIDDLYKTFLQMLSERRPSIQESNKKDVISGKIFTGKQALELGLVDQIGSPIQAKEWLYQSYEDLKDLPVQKYKLLEPEYSLLEYFRHLPGTLTKKLESARMHFLAE